MKKKDFIYNIITGFGGQFIVILLGIIVPRIMITSYGSDINGLVSTLGQIFTYLALLEAGIGQSARIALYKPIAKKDKEEISKVFVAANSYFRKFSIFYAIGVIAIALFVPFTIKSKVDYLTILLITLLEGFSGVISFYFSQTQVVLLNADGKGHVNNSINLLNRILAYIAKVVLAYMGYSILLIQFVYFIITVIKAIFYYRYFKKNYSWIDNSLKSDNTLLKDKNSYLITEIAWTVFSSTDMIVLSMFVSTKLSSVYSVYAMIYSALNTLLTSVSGSILYVLGQVYHESIEKYRIVHDSFNTVFIGSITILVSTAYMLTVPFLKLYTRGVTDVDYIQPELPIMFCLVQILSWNRYVTGNLTAIAGYAKQTSVISIIEAMVNLICSVVLVNYYGIVGVLFATVIALPVKVIWCLYISDIKVLKRSLWKSLSIFGVNYLLFFAVVYATRFIPLEIDSYISFIQYGAVLTVIIGLIGIILNIIVNKECVSVVRRYSKKQKEKI